MAPASRRTPDSPESDVDSGQPPADLTGAVVAGVLWKVTTRTVAEATRIIVIIVLARLLTPSDYGIAGMALVFASFGMLLTDAAMGAALIQQRTIDERDRSTVFWTAAGLGAALTIVALATSGLVADFFGEPEVKSLFAASSVCFLVSGLSVAHRALLTRRLAYRSLELREMAAILAGGAAAIAVAVAGFGPWAIVSNFITYSVVSAVLAWLLLEWRPKATYSLESARRLGSFSTKIFSASVLTWGNQNVDKTLVGRVLGAAPLGAYSLAYSTMQMPVVLVAGTIHQALTPAYARIQQDRKRLEGAWLRNKRLSVALVAPALTGVIVVAPDLVDVFFGDEWEAAVTPLQLLCLGGIASSLGALNWSVLQASGEAGVLLRLTLLTAAVTWTAFAVGLAWGIVGVAGFYAAARWLLVLPTTWMTARGVSFDFWPALKAGGGMLPLAGAAGIAALGARELLLQTELPGILRLALVGLVLTLVYGALLALVMPAMVDEIRNVLRTAPKPAPAPAS